MAITTTFEIKKFKFLLKDITASKKAKDKKR